MPFTLSHPALILPLRRTALPFSALFIGAMTPDFNYFIFEYSANAHTIPGVFKFCLPAGLIAYLLFHYLLKYPLIDLFPSKHAGFLYSHAKPPIWRSFTNVFWLFFAVIIGAFSHLFWDSFTHFDGWFVVRAKWMSAQIIDYGFLQLSIFRFLQHISTLAGLAILAYTYGLAYIRRPEGITYRPFLRNGFRKLLLLLLPLIVIVVTGILLKKEARHLQTYTMIRGFIYQFVITILKCSGLTLALYSIIWHSFHVLSGHGLAGKHQADINIATE